jgi:hypothetical protein
VCAAPRKINKLRVLAILLERPGEIVVDAKDADAAAFARNMAS